MDKQDLEDLKHHSGILQVYNSRVPLKRDGAEFKGLCPFHSEKTPSFRVSSHQGTLVFKCFGCGKSGDVLTLIQHVDNLSFTESVEKLKSELGSSFSDTKKSEKIFSSLSEPKPAISFSLVDYFKYEKALELNQTGRDWLKSRGISYDTAKELHIGYRQDLGKIAGEDNQDISDKGWISFPAIVGDRVLSIKYRSVVRKTFAKQPGMAKGDQTQLFNTNDIEALEGVYLTEGEPDAAVLKQVGFKAASIQSASTPLTATNKEKLLEADYIILAGDNDSSGNEYMNKLWSEMQERTYKLIWPDGFKDANQVFLEICGGDKDKFKGLVEDLTAKSKSNLMPGVSNLRETLKQSQRVNKEDSPYRWRWPWSGMDGMANIMPGSVVYLSSTNTGMGKTTLMMNASLFNAIRGEVILNYSAELSDQEYAEIAVSHLLKKDRHNLTPEDYKDKAYTILSNTRYYIGRDNDLNKANDVLDLIENAVRRSSAGTVILDTVHFICTNEADTIKAQENLMNRSKSLSQKYGLKWFNLGQPRKAKQENKGKAIHITDAKGSEMLISASDVAYAIHRNTSKVDDPDHPPKEPYEPLTQIFLQKGRSLGKGAAYTELLFQGDICTFFPVTKEIDTSILFTGE